MWTPHWHYRWGNYQHYVPTWTNNNKLCVGVWEKKRLCVEWGCVLHQEKGFNSILAHYWLNKLPFNQSLKCNRRSPLILTSCSYCMEVILQPKCSLYVPHRGIKWHYSFVFVLHREQQLWFPWIPVDYSVLPDTLAVYLCVLAHFGEIMQ